MSNSELSFEILDQQSLPNIIIPIKLPCVIPPPIPPKQTNLPPFAVVKSSTSSSSNIICKDFNSENKFKNVETNTKKLEKDLSSLLLTNLFNEEDGSLDPFAAISNPFVTSSTASTQHILNKELNSTQQEPLPRFTDFIEMNLT